MRMHAQPGCIAAFDGEKRAIWKISCRAELQQRDICPVNVTKANRAVLSLAVADEQCFANILQMVSHSVRRCSMSMSNLADTVRCA